MAELIEVCIAAGVGGLKVGGGRRLPEPELGIGIGTLHGREIFEAALENVERAASFARAAAFRSREMAVSAALPGCVGNAPRRGNVRRSLFRLRLSGLDRRARHQPTTGPAVVAISPLALDRVLQASVLSGVLAPAVADATATFTGLVRPTAQGRS